MYGYDKPIFLFDEASMDLSEVTIVLVVHVKFSAIVKPFLHGVLVIEGHYLRKDLVYWFLCDLLFEVARHFYETIVYCENLAHWGLGSWDYKGVIAVDFEGMVLR